MLWGFAYNRNAMSLARAQQRETRWKLGEYRRMLAQCSNEELQDIYFHIDVVQYPERYRAVLEEITRRGLQPVSGVEPQLVLVNIPEQVRSLPAFRTHPMLSVLVASAVLTIYTALVTFLFCLPIYLLALPLKVLNQQSAFVYLLSVPFAPLTAAGFGRRAGGQGGYLVAVALGVVLGMLAFLRTGALQAVVQALFRSAGTGGFSLPMGY